MFGLPILDVVIGLSVVFFLFSLLVSAVREAVESVLKARAVHLERGIRELLDDPDGTGRVQQLYSHPLLFSLYQGTFQAKLKRFRGTGLPTYIPSAQFASALIDLVLRGPLEEQGTAAGDVPFTIEALRSKAAAIKSVRVRRALLNAIDQADGDLTKVRLNLESWFNGTMDRVSGWYKRSTQYWLFGIGFVAAVALNINAFTIAEYLGQNPAVRERLVAHAQQIAEAGTPAPAAEDEASVEQKLAAARAQLDRFQTEMASVSIPIGWDRQPAAPACRPASLAGGLLTQDCSARYLWRFRELAGLLLTAVAATLGALFWFDLINKVSVIRSTVKPREKSQDEGSEDRR